MKCPKCSSDLVTFEIEGIKLEQCESCEGLWFEKNKLREVKDRTDSDLNWLDFEIVEHQDEFKLSAPKYNCPRCNVKMEVLEYDKTKVDIDYCNSCQGVWLDKGEVQCIIEALEDELSSKPVDEYLKDTLDEAKELISGPESFISEWKDFSTILRFLQYRILTENPKLADIILKIQNNPLNR